MEVLILGTGDAFTREHFGSSALIRTDAGCGVLIDCPDLIHRAMHEATSGAGWEVDALDIGDIVLTHLHGDHCNGLESFGFYHRIARARTGEGSLPRIHTVSAIASRLWERLAPAMDGDFGGIGGSSLDDYFEMHTFEPGETTPIAGLTVESRFTGHPVPTIGLRVSDEKATLGWSGDTPFEQAHIDWLATADLIVHETNVGASHTPIERLNALPEELRHRIRLIHMTDDYSPASSPIVPLRDGELLRL